jgi:hypothetical protein
VGGKRKCRAITDERTLESHCRSDAHRAGTRKFDKILAVRVGLFHREPGRGRAIIEKWLKPAGQATIVYDEP